MNLNIKPKEKLNKEKQKLHIKHHTCNNKGITLIALIITIVILLILAVVAINAVQGDGIITKAKTARDKTNIANVKEMAQIDILGYQAENQNGEITTKQLKDVLSKYFKDVPEEGELKEKLKDPDYSLKVKKEYGGDSIEVRVSDIYAAKLEELAKDVLKVNPGATNDYEKSPYVKYNGILCRVFYNDTEHGLQIISADNIKSVDGNKEKITLGKDDPTVNASDFAYEGTADVDDDFKKAAASYNNAVDTLNDEAKKYMNSDDGIAIDARSLGSIANLTDDGKFQGDTTTETYPTDEYYYLSSFKDKFKNADTNYEKDVAQLKALGLNASSITWLASRYVNADSGGAYFFVHLVLPNGSVSFGHTFYVYPYGDALSFSNSDPFRPVFLLSSNVKIKGDGDGTSENPYELEI